MENSNGHKAKRIVRDGLDKWSGTYAEFKALASTMGQAAKDVTSPETREAFVKNYLREVKSEIYSKEVAFEFSNNYAIVHGQASLDNEIEISENQRQEIVELTQMLAQYEYKLKNKKTFVFIVKDETKYPTNELILLIFAPRGESKSDLFSAHAVAVVKKHCLERIVERLNLNNLDAAIDEILPATTWLEGSGKELAGRNIGSYGDGMKRNVPTPNGALLLLTTSVEGAEIPTQDCSLITWIHKRQFKKNQEVTNSEFKYAMAVNYFLSDPNLPGVIANLKNELAIASKSSEITTVYVYLHGECYKLTDFLASLELGKFLDFTIDFERELVSR